MKNMKYPEVLPSNNKVTLNWVNHPNVTMIIYKLVNGRWKKLGERKRYFTDKSLKEGETAQYKMGIKHPTILNSLMVEYKIN
jgi:hypothetical protein